MNNKPSLRVASMTNVQALDKIVFLSQRSTPVKQINSNNNQYIGGYSSQAYQNKFKTSYSTAQNVTAPGVEKKQLTGQNSSIASILEQRTNGRSGSDYQFNNAKVSNININVGMDDNANLKAQKYPKLNIRSEDFSTLVKQLYSPEKKSSIQFNNKIPTNNTSNGNSPTYYSLLYNLPKSQSQSKMSTLQTDNYQPKISTFRNNYAVLTSPLSEILEMKKKGFKRKPHNQHSGHLLTGQSSKLELDNNSKIDFSAPKQQLKEGCFFFEQKYTNNKFPQTTRSITTSSILGQKPLDINPQSTRNLQEQQQQKQLKMKQLQVVTDKSSSPSSTLANLQKLNAQFQDQRNKSKEVVKSIYREDVSSPKQKPVVQTQNLLDQFVTQVKIGTNNLKSQAPITIKNSKPKETQSYRQIENIKQMSPSQNAKYQEQVSKEREKEKENQAQVQQQYRINQQKSSRSVSLYYMSKMALFQTQECENNQFAQIYRDHFVQSYHALGFCSVLAPQNSSVVISKTVFLSRKPTLFNKTVVLDLDETLIHCNENTQIPSDVILPIEFPNGEVISAGINVRPHVEYLLSQLTSLCEVIVFTASHSCYANKVIDHIDPSRKLIHHRLFRDSCVTTEEGVHIKDLRILGDRDLKDVVLVDNAAYSYGLQLDNGIPIIPFYNNKKDSELLDLLVYLKTLLSVADVRQHNRKTFRMYEYTSSNTIENALANVCLDQR